MRSPRKKRVFVSFDYDHDLTLRNFIIGQAKLSDSPFVVADYSLKEAAPEPLWELRARRAIAQSEMVLVMLGPRTRFAKGVLKEIRMAKELGRSVIQIIGYRDGSAAWRIPGAGRVYAWNWPNLKKLLG